MDKEIIFKDLTKPQDLFLLKDYLREIYRLLDKRFVEVDFSATPTFDVDEGEVFKITLTGNVTGAIIKNAYKGRVITLIVLQDATGSRTFAFSTTVKLSGGAWTITSTASVYSVLTLVYDDDAWVEIGRSLDTR